MGTNGQGAGGGKKCKRWISEGWQVYGDSSFLSFSSTYNKARSPANLRVVLSIVGPSLQNQCTSFTSRVSIRLVLLGTVGGCASWFFGMKDITKDLWQWNLYGRVRVRVSGGGLYPTQNAPIRSHDRTPFGISKYHSIHSHIHYITKWQATDTSDIGCHDYHLHDYKAPGDQRPTIF